MPETPTNLGPDEAAEVLRLDLAEVEAYRRKKDMIGANRVLLLALRKFVEAKYPFLTTESTSYGFEVTMNGYRFIAMGASAQDLIRTNLELTEPQQVEIGAAIRHVQAAKARALLFVVTGPRVKAAVLRAFGGKLEGIEVWSVDDLIRLDIPLRG